MGKKIFAVICVLTLICSSLIGCGTPQDDTSAIGNAPIADGVYQVDFNTDSSMFHVNETCDGKGTLTVENGFMTVHVTLASKKIVNLYLGVAEDAKKDGAKVIEPTIDEVTYSDGDTEEVYGFDIPVAELDTEFDLAVIGTKGNWYDHKVSVSSPVSNTNAIDVSTIENGTYTIEVALKGGSGKATIESPAELTVENGECQAKLVWSSPYYEYVVVSDVQYDREDTEGNSTMTIPVVLDQDMAISALTTAMSEPHLIDYTLHFDSSTIK